MFANVNVSGFGTSLLWKHLSTKGGEIKENWTKFLISREGKILRRFSQVCSFAKIEKAIEEALKEG